MNTAIQQLEINNHFNFISGIKPTEDIADLREAIGNIKATLQIQKKKGNPDADFLLRRL